MSATRTSTSLPIGEVLKLLADEFPEISISKIRFLESEGLITPERTPSGYRKFSPDDVGRLRFILKAQRDQFMPLKVIRRKLQHFDPTAPEQETATEQMTEPGQDDLPTVNLDGGLSLTFDELVRASGLAADELTQLEEFGLLDAHSLGDGSVIYDEADLAVARIAKDFARYGIGPRHLRMYKVFADKEAGTYAPIAATFSRSGTEGRKQAKKSLAHVGELSKRLKQLLFEAALREYLSQ